MPFISVLFLKIVVTLDGGIVAELLKRYIERHFWDASNVLFLDLGTL